MSTTLISKISKIVSGGQTGADNDIRTMKTMKILFLVLVAVSFCVLPIKAGEPIEGILGIVITNFQFEGNAADGLKALHESWKKAGKGQAVPDIISSATNELIRFDLPPTQVKDILEMFCYWACLKYEITPWNIEFRPKGYDLGMYYPYVKVLPLTVEGAKRLGLNKTVGNCEATQQLLGSYGITPVWHNYPTNTNLNDKAVYEPGKGGLIISHFKEDVLLKTQYLIWLADHGFILPVPTIPKEDLFK